MRERLLIFILFLCVYKPAAAQSLKSSILISANFSYDRDRTEVVFQTGSEEVINKTLTLQPKIGYFILSRLCAGVYVPYTRAVFEGDVLNYNNVKETDQSYGIGPFIRYYQPIVTNFYGIAQAGFSWEKQINERYIFPIGKVEERVTQKYSLIGVGLSYFVTHSLAVEMMLDFREQLTDDSGDPPYSYYDETIFTLGFQIYLGKDIK